MYNELRITSLVLNLVDSLFTAIAFFSIGYAIVYFYRINIFVAYVVGTIFFLRSLVMKVRQNKIILLENKFPDLKERLRTSFDYQEKTNTVINELHSDIVKIMKKVDINAFLNSKTLLIKIFVICSFLTTTLYLSAIGFDIIDVKNSITKSKFYQGATSFAQDFFDTRDEITDRPLLENPRLITLGDRELNLTIEAYNTELDISEISGTEQNDYGGHYPEEIAGVAQETYDERIPEEYKDIIKEYFRRINK